MADDDLGAAGKAADVPQTNLPKKPEPNKPADKEDAPPFRIVAISIVVAVVLLLIYALRAKAEASQATVFAVELLVGLAALVSGALFGFMFGIPRTPQRSAGGEAKSAYEPSNNLEQVSDWLTKVLVGATLVQIRELRTFLSLIGLRVSQGIGGSATSVVTQLNLVVFAVLGFLSGFLWTRVYYASIQANADKKAAGIAGELEAVKRQTQENKKDVELAREDAAQAKATAGQVLQSTAPAPVSQADLAAKTARDPGLLEKLNRFRAAPVNWEGDPVEEVFGTRPSEADGFTLTGKVEIVQDRSVLLTFIVEGSTTQPLDGDVLFLLHPTYDRREVAVRARNNRAILTVVSESWYHVGAVIGQTVLVLDLRKIRGVPEWFKAD